MVFSQPTKIQAQRLGCQRRTLHENAPHPVHLGLADLVSAKAAGQSHQKVEQVGGQNFCQSLIGATMLVIRFLEIARRRARTRHRRPETIHYQRQMCRPCQRIQGQTAKYQFHRYHKRRNHLPRFKAKFALSAIKGDRTLAELSGQFDVHQNEIQDWRKQLLDQADTLFGSGQEHKTADEAHPKDLHAKIGALALENNFLA